MYNRDLPAGYPCQLEVRPSGTGADYCLQAASHQPELLPMDGDLIDGFLDAAVANCEALLEVGLQADRVLKVQGVIVIFREGLV